MPHQVLLYISLQILFYIFLSLPGVEAHLRAEGSWVHASVIYPSVGAQTPPKSLISCCCPLFLPCHGLIYPYYPATPLKGPTPPLLPLSLRSSCPYPPLYVLLFPLTLYLPPFYIRHPSASSPLPPYTSSLPHSLHIALLTPHSTLLQYPLTWVLWLLHYLFLHN